MRSFSIEEQRVINRIVNDASRSLQYVLINAYYDIFYNNKVDYNVQEPGHLIFYREFDSVNIDNLLSVQQQIIIQSRLIQYLADNRLIYLIENNSVNKLSNVADFSKDDLNAITVPIDSVTAEIIQDSLSHYIIVTQDLKNLVANGYISDEERRHQEQIQNAESRHEEQIQKAEQANKIAIRSYRLAMCAFLAAIIIPIATAFFIPFTLAKSQYNGIITKIETKPVTLMCDSLATTESIDNIKIINDSIVHDSISIQQQ